MKSCTEFEATPLPSESRRFLFLQGHPSAFWSQLADALTERSHAVFKINFSLADLLFWGIRRGSNFRGNFDEWPAWLEAYLRKNQITDILYYGDGHPYHQSAATLGAAIGLRCWVIEHGYLRPDWLTLEPFGMGARSLFPRDWSQIEKLATDIEPPGTRRLFHHTFSQEAIGEVSYNLLQAFGRPLFPRFVSDRLYWPVLDYVSWLPHLFAEKRRAAAASTLLDNLVARKTQFNLVALQLQSDYMVRQSENYADLGAFVRFILASFQSHAPSDRHLVFKVHPLDNGLERWFKRIPREAEKLGFGNRVHVIRGGDLEQLLKTSRGVVLLNSTVGIHALRAGTPVCALGRSVFTLEGLTHQVGLDSFWTEPETPDPGKFALFERAISSIQVRGSFFNRDGRMSAIREICDRLTLPEITPCRYASDILDNEAAIPCQ